MDALREIMKTEAKILGYSENEIMYGEASHLKLNRFIRAVAKSYASQALDLAADKVEIKYVPYNTELNNDPEWDLDNDGRFYQIDKDSILKLKDQLK